MLDRILENVDRKLAYKLMVLHIIIIAVSNYIVQFKIDIAGHPLSVAAFTFPKCGDWASTIAYGAIV